MSKFSQNHCSIKPQPNPPVILYTTHNLINFKGFSAALYTR